MKILSNALDFVMKIVSWFLVFILGVMTVVLFLSVASRYVLGFSMHWTDPVARYGLVWIMLLGSPLVLRKGLHIGVDYFIGKLNEKFRSLLLRFNVFLILIFSLVMTIQGFTLIEISKGQKIPEMGIPMEIIYYMVPVAGVVMVLTSVEMFLRKQIDSITTAEGEE